MTDYGELVKALRIRSGNLCPGDICDRCEAIHFLCSDKVMHDAAAAIEELDAEETRLLLITSELQDKVVELEEELNDADIAADDNARQVEELQAEVKRLEQKRERGEWKTDPHGIRWCSLCDSYYQDVGYGFNYCPNCGAKMTEVQDGQ